MRRVKVLRMNQESWSVLHPSHPCQSDSGMTRRVKNTITPTLPNIPVSGHTETLCWSITRLVVFICWVDLMALSTQVE